MLIPRRTVRTSQPQQPAQVNWRNPITKGLYTATVPGQGDVLSSAALSLPTDSKLATLVAGKAVGQAVSGTTSTGIAFPKRNLEQRTELFIQFCSSRKLYGQWMVSANGSDKYSGEYSDTELGWTIHGTGWNTSTPVGGYSAPYSLIGRVAVLCFTWGKDLNGGYGRCFLDSKELTRSGGSPHTTNSDRTLISSESSSIGPAQNDNNIFLFLAWDRALSSGEVKSVSENPWQIFEDEEEYRFITSAGGTSTVSSDASAVYNVLGSLQYSATASYDIRSAIQSDSSASYSVRGSLQQSIVSDYGIRTSTQQNAASTYAIRGLVAQDVAPTYSIRGSASNDASSAYNILSATSVSASASAGYNIRGNVNQDVAAIYALRGSVTQDTSATYSILSASAVSSSVTAGYAIKGSVQSSIVAGYSIAQSVQAEIAASYIIRAGAVSEAQAAYVIRGLVQQSIAASYAVEGSTFTGSISAPSGSGPTVIQPGSIRPRQSATSRPSNTGGRRY